MLFMLDWKGCRQRDGREKVGRSSITHESLNKKRTHCGEISSDLQNCIGKMWGCTGIGKDELLLRPTSKNSKTSCKIKNADADSASEARGCPILLTFPTVCQAPRCSCSLHAAASRFYDNEHHGCLPLGVRPSSGLSCKYQAHTGLFATS